MNSRSLVAACMFGVVSLATTASLAATHAMTYGDWDTRAFGLYTPTLAPSNDADGSLLMQTTGNTSQSKVSVVFYDPTSPLAPIGTLGTLNTLMLDMYKSSVPLTDPGANFAVRVHLTDPTVTSAAAVNLVYENAYNGNAPVPTDTWQNDFSLMGMNFWQRGNGQNFDVAGGWVPLSAWTSGFQYTNGASSTVLLGANTPVYSVEIAFGSGVSSFLGAIDDVRVGFAGGDDYVGNVSVPAPGAVALVGAGGLLMHRRRRR